MRFTQQRLPLSSANIRTVHVHFTVASTNLSTDPTNPPVFHVRRMNLIFLLLSHTRGSVVVSPHPSSSHKLVNPLLHWSHIPGDLSLRCPFSLQTRARKSRMANGRVGTTAVVQLIQRVSGGLRIGAGAGTKEPIGVGGDHSAGVWGVGRGWGVQSPTVFFSTDWDTDWRTRSALRLGGKEQNEHCGGDCSRNAITATSPAFLFVFWLDSCVTALRRESRKVAACPGGRKSKGQGSVKSAVFGHPPVRSSSVQGQSFVTFVSLCRLALP